MIKELPYCIHYTGQIGGGLLTCFLVLVTLHLTQRPLSSPVMDRPSHRINYTLTLDHICCPFPYFVRTLKLQYFCLKGHMGMAKLLLDIVDFLS